MNGKINFSNIRNCNQVWEDMESCRGEYSTLKPKEKVKEDYNKLHSQE